MALFGGHAYADKQPGLSMLSRFRSWRWRMQYWAMSTGWTQHHNFIVLLTATITVDATAHIRRAGRR